MKQARGLCRIGRSPAPAALAILATTMLWAAPAAAQVQRALPPGPPATQVPRPLADLVLGASKRSLVEFQVQGVPFQGMPVFSREPYILWPREEAERLPAPDRVGLERWISAAAPELGFEGFRARYAESWAWHGGTVWSYALEHAGLELWRARVQVHLQDGRLLGLALDVPQPLLGIEPGADGIPRDGSFVLQPERSERGYRAVATAVQITRAGGLTTTTVGNQRVVAMTQFPPASPVPKAWFTEWDVPLGQYPDQIDVDSKGMVWFSQPADNFLTRFDPTTQTFTQFWTTGGSGPDGMRVGSQDRVWTGLYFGGGLGRLDTNGVHTAFAAPYAPANMAGPLECSQGTIWITDHQANRISEFDPISSTWLGSHVLPSPASWVVEGSEDVGNAVIYYSCYGINKLAYKPLGQPIQETPTLGVGPAFPVYSGGMVYYSLGSTAALGRYDVQTGQHTLFSFPLPAELGGPIAATTDGRIVVGTRGAGYIMVFHPSTSSFSHYKIPTTLPGNLKDGLTIGNNGEVWFTETFANKIARLRLP